MQAAPTPYDITALPDFPWDPPLSLWLAVILFSIIIYLYFRIKSSVPKKNVGSINPIQASIAELRTISTSNRSLREKCELISRLLKRILSVSLPAHLKLNLYKLNLNDLEVANLDPQIKELLSLTLRLEELSYAPSFSEIEFNNMINGLEVKLSRLS